jgi:hypothetical protein
VPLGSARAALSYALLSWLQRFGHWPSGDVLSFALVLKSLSSRLRFGLHA